MEFISYQWFSSLLRKWSEVLTLPSPLALRSLLLRDHFSLIRWLVREAFNTRDSKWIKSTFIKAVYYIFILNILTSKGSHLASWLCFFVLLYSQRELFAQTKKVLLPVGLPINQSIIYVTRVFESHNSWTSRKIIGSGNTLSASVSDLGRRLYSNQ